MDYNLSGYMKDVLEFWKMMEYVFIFMDVKRPALLGAGRVGRLYVKRIDGRVPVVK
jgi:hypothetical protein